MSIGPHSPKRLALKAPPFRLRAFFLALLAGFMGIASLVFALAGDDREPRRSTAKSADPGWPEGFVEVDEGAFPTSSAAISAGSSSIDTPAPSSATVDEP